MAQEKTRERREQVEPGLRAAPAGVHEVVPPVEQMHAPDRIEAYRTEAAYQRAVGREPLRVILARAGCQMRDPGFRRVAPDTSLWVGCTHERGDREAGSSTEGSPGTGQGEGRLP